MDQDEKIEFLGGQFHALLGFATAVIASHPDLPALVREIEGASLGSIALSSASPVSDSYMDGVFFVWERLRQAVEKSQGRESNPKAQR